MRAAPLVLTLALLTVLVRADRDVLGAVVLRDRARSAATAGAAAKRPASSSCLRGESLLARSRRTMIALPRSWPPRWPSRTAASRREAPGELPAGARKLGHLERAAQEAALGVGREQRLHAGCDLDLAAVRAHRARPVARAVHEHPVCEGHPSQADSVAAHASSVRTTCRRKRVPAQIVDRDPLVRGMHEPCRELGFHRAHREEAIRDRSEGGAQTVAVGETGTDDGCDARARPSATNASIASQRAVATRARAAVFPRASEARRNPGRGAPGWRARPPPVSRREADGSRRRRRTPPDHVRAFDASTIVGAIVVKSIGSTVAEHAVEASQPVEGLRV